MGPKLNMENVHPNAGSSESSAKRAKKEKEQPQRAPQGGCPFGSEAIKFQQPNPKRDGTASHARYEKYMKAKTPQQALSLGAVKGDLVNDYTKGYMKRTS